MAATAGGAPLTGASQAGLASPIDIKSTVYNPLPNGTGNGLSAFYYALLLLLAGFTGSIVVSTLVDSLLGYVPAEWGPVYRFAEQANISRFRTLLVKWGDHGGAGVADVGASTWPSPTGSACPSHSAGKLWAYGVFAIIAVGVTSSSLIAVLGSMGLLFSMLVFVILGLPSAGATVPLEAVPPLFRWLAEFEPMHQVFLGVRSLLYLNGAAASRFVPGVVDDGDRPGHRAVGGRHHHAHLRPQRLSPDPGGGRDGDRGGAPSPTPGARGQERRSSRADARERNRA